MKLNPLDEVKGRYVVIILLSVFFIVGPLLMFFSQTLMADSQPIQSSRAGFVFTVDNVAWLMTYPLIALGLYLLAKPYASELAALIVKKPNADDIRRYIFLGLGMVISAYGFVYLAFYPLSFIVPDWVQVHLLDVPPLWYWDEYGYYMIGNAAGVMMAVVFAPMVEEFLFRGYLLNRWTQRYGASSAVVFSSALFAILHPDILGAFIFAVIMCWLYMQTGSLIGPIVVHISNNVIAVLLDWVSVKWLDGLETSTIEEFQQMVWLGVLGLAIGVPWLWFFIKRQLQSPSVLYAAHEQGKLPPSLT